MQHCAKAITGDEKSVTKKIIILLFNHKSSVSQIDSTYPRSQLRVSKLRIMNLETKTPTSGEYKQSTLDIVLYSIDHT